MWCEAKNVQVGVVAYENEFKQKQKYAEVVKEHTNYTVKPYK
jgi:hypothetical protein